MTRNRARKLDTWKQADETGDAYNVARRALISKAGMPLTDEYVQQLADEAEAGYDPDKLVPRKA